MAYLLGLNGKRQGRDLQLDRDLIHFGRSEVNDYMLEDPSVSGRHCTIIRQGDDYLIRDLDSSNGTRVNDHAVQESKIVPGDVIEMGSLLFRYLEGSIGEPGQAVQIADVGDPFREEGEEAEPEPRSDSAFVPAPEVEHTEPPPAAPDVHREDVHPPSSVALPSGRMPIDLTHRSMNYTFIAIGGVIVLTIAVVVYLNLVMS